MTRADRIDVKEGNTVFVFIDLRSLRVSMRLAPPRGPSSREQYGAHLPCGFLVGDDGAKDAVVVPVSGELPLLNLLSRRSRC